MPTDPTMSAVVLHEHGGPEVLRLERIPRPDPETLDPASGQPLWTESAGDTVWLLLDLDGKSARALRNSGLLTLGSIARYRRERYGNCRLTNLGIAGKDELKIEEALMLAANGLVLTANVLHRKKKKGKSAAV